RSFFFDTLLGTRSRQLNAKPLGGWGSVVGIPCWSYASVANVRARRAGARCAGVVRSPVVLLARGAQPDRVLRMVLISARCAGVIPCQCGAVMRGSKRA